MFVYATRCIKKKKKKKEEEEEEEEALTLVLQLSISIRWYASGAFRCNVTLLALYNTCYELGKPEMLFSR